MNHHKRACEHCAQLLGSYQLRDRYLHIVHLRLQHPGEAVDCPGRRAAA